MPVDGETMATMQDSMDMRDVMKGTMSQTELNDRRAARADGTITGLAILDGASAVRGAVAVAPRISSIIRSMVSIEGPGKGLAKYGVGRIGQIRFGGGGLILRLDKGRGLDLPHLNIESHPFGFNLHIPLNPLRWF